MLGLLIEFTNFLLIISIPKKQMESILDINIKQQTNNTAYDKNNMEYIVNNQWVILPIKKVHLLAIFSLVF